MARPEDLSKEKEIERRELEVAERQNGYWLGCLRRMNVLGRDPRLLRRRRQEIDAITPEWLQTPSAATSRPGATREVTLMPEVHPDAGN